MKRTIFVVILKLSVLALLSHFQRSKSRSSDTKVSTPTSDSITSNIDQNSLGDTFLRQYRLSEPPHLALPNGVYKQQVYIEPKYIDNFYEYDGRYFAVYFQSNINFPIEKDNGGSGILVANMADISWGKFIDIVDTNQADNNPILFWRESGVFYALIVDDRGAGSGDGIAKLVEINESGREFTTLKCFYYSQEDFLTIVSKYNEDLPLGAAIMKYSTQGALDGSIPESIYLQEQDIWIQYNPAFGSTTIGEVNDDCDNFEPVFR